MCDSYTEIRTFSLLLCFFSLRSIYFFICEEAEQITKMYTVLFAKLWFQLKRRGRKGRMEWWKIKKIGEKKKHQKSKMKKRWFYIFTIISGNCMFSLYYRYVLSFFPFFFNIILPLYFGICTDLKINYSLMTFSLT